MGMDKTRKMMFLLARVLLFTCLVLGAQDVPGTNNVPRNIVVPEKFIPTDVNELLTRIGRKPLCPHRPENKRDMDFRVITV